MSTVRAAVLPPGMPTIVGADGRAHVATAADLAPGAPPPVAAPRAGGGMPTIVDASGRAHVATAADLRPGARPPVAARGGPPAPVVVGRRTPGTTIARIAPHPAGRRLGPARIRYPGHRLMSRTLPPQLLPPGGMREGLGQGATLTQQDLAQLGEAYQQTIAHLAVAAQPVLAFACVGAIDAWQRGITPSQYWRPETAKSIAQALLEIGAVSWVRDRIADGVWTLWTNGEDLAATETATALSVPGMGWIPDAYITGDPNRRATALDRLSFSVGIVPFASAIAGPEAVGAVGAEAAAVATAEEGAAVARAALPQAMGQGAAAASAAARVTAGWWRTTGAALLKATAPIVKWAAIGTIGVAGVKEIPNLLHANRQATAAATNAGINAAGDLIDLGMKNHDPAMVRAGMEWMLQFQKGTTESDKYLFGIGGLVGGLFLAKK